MILSWGFGVSLGDSEGALAGVALSLLNRHIDSAILENALLSSRHLSSLIAMSIHIKRDTFSATILLSFAIFVLPG